MHPDITEIERKHRLFIEQVAASGAVWGLSRNDGWAVSLSHDYEDTEVMPFWSDRAYATAVAVNDWAGYTPQKLSLSEFMEDWLMGMHQDATLAGTNWDAKLSGKETEPLALALELIAELKATRKTVPFRQYKTLAGFETQIQQELAGE